MSGNRDLREDLTAVDAVLGTTTIAVFLADAALLILFLSPVWSARDADTVGAAITTTHLLLGLAAAVGIVFRALGTTGRLANRWSPMSLVALRLALIAIAWPGVAGEWGVESAALLSGYLLPTTVLLGLLAFANLSRRIEKRDSNSVGDG